LWRAKPANRLFADYKRSVHLFTDGLLRLRGALEDDSRLGAKQVDRLRQACERARDVLMEHRRVEHDGSFSSKLGSS
jgi:hypothetical protein